MKDHKTPTLAGVVQVESVSILWGLASMVPLNQIQPNMVVLLGQLIVFQDERQSLLVYKACKTCLQLNSSLIVSPPQ